MAQRLQGAAADFLRRKFGGELTDQTGNPTVDTTLSRVLTNDPERVLAFVQNLGSEIVYLGFQPSVSATNGIQLDPGGGSMEIDVEADGMLPTYSIYAVSASGTQQLFTAVIRRFRQDDES